LALVFFGLLVLAGCSTQGSGDQPATKVQDSSSSTATENQTPTGGDALYTPTYVPNGEESALIKTSQGDITVKLYGKDAPVHVGNFIELARKGYYDQIKFHRYVPDFVIQGGDPATRDASSEEVAQAAASGGGGFGAGGPGYRIKAEFDPSVNPNKHVEGALGMARTQDPDSAGSQFYFALAPLPSLDGQYTVFGGVTDGMDVVKALRAGDTIESVEILGAEE
jgi:peptidyl-prolyl cis-trans isomerase B (cyclophilin B)